VREMKRIIELAGLQPQARIIQITEVHS